MKVDLKSDYVRTYNIMKSTRVAELYKTINDMVIDFHFHVVYWFQVSNYKFIVPA